VPSVS